MACRSSVTYRGENVVLVPYKRRHVQKYHEWMQSEELQRLTASEPLTLEEEYRMQESWEKDSNKCTFIILDKNTYQVTKNEVDSMIGDTNIFLTNDEGYKTGEIEIMIAEPEARGKRRGWESTLLMMIYGIEFLQVKKYKAKISTSNEKSISMFSKMQFEKVSESDVFNEITMERLVTNDWTSWLFESAGNYTAQIEVFCNP